MNQKGFIPILIIVIALIIVASAGTGMVLYSQGKLSPFIANITEVFKGAEDAAPIEEEVIQKAEEAEIQSEEARIKAERAELEVEKLKQQAEVAKEETERARLLAEAEKAKAEAEKARLEAERARVEVERLRKEIEETKEEVAQLSITKISPGQILNNIDNELTISGFGIQEGIEVKIGDIYFGTGNVIDDETIIINISQGALYPSIYSVEIVNSDGKTAILYNALKVTEPQAPTPTELTTEEISIKVSPAVVQIRNDSVPGGTGSGVIIDSIGYILTNEHVITGDPVVEVRLNNGSRVNGLVIGWNRSYDLAVVKITGDNFPYVNLGNSDDVNIGQDVVALGYPLSDFPSSITVLEGIIAKKSILLLQISASIQPGSSGGALVDKSGKLIGINASCDPKAIIIYWTNRVCIPGYGYAITVNTIKSILSDLKAGTKISFGISNMQISDIGINSATVTWTTIEPATSQVWYGATTGLGNSTPLYSSLVLSHSVNLSGLNPDTTYYFKVVSEDLKGSQEISPLQSFSTP